jgi:hypothetical protein
LDNESYHDEGFISSGSSAEDKVSGGAAELKTLPNLAKMKLFCLL